jgi:hypothetical protein
MSIVLTARIVYWMQIFAKKPPLLAANAESFRFSLSFAV